jgi:hypothetical protein
MRFSILIENLVRKVAIFIYGLLEILNLPQIPEGKDREGRKEE